MCVWEKRRGRKRRLWARWKGKERIRGHRVHVVEEGEKSEQRARDAERRRRRDAGGNAEIVGRTGGEQRASEKKRRFGARQDGG